MSGSLVGIVMGSDSDLSIMKESAIILEELNIPYDITISSAHRTPKHLTDYVINQSFEVIIAGAGGAAHLPGVIASHTLIPVIGVPINATDLNGLDSLYAIVQMPSGIPVATMAIGKAGAKNAGIYAAQIIGLNNPEVRERIATYRDKLSQSVLSKSEKLAQLGWRDYLKQKST